MSCNYNKSIHMTPEADKYHVDKCVMNTMEKMSNKEKCIRYMAGVMNANNTSKSCSIKNLENICEKHQQNFTMEDAKLLCIKKKEASKSFWMNKNISIKMIPEEKEKTNVNKNSNPIKNQESNSNQSMFNQSIPSSFQNVTWEEKARKL